MMFAGLMFTAELVADDASANLLKGGNFTELNDKGCPAGWRSNQSCFSLDQTVRPEGVGQSLKVAVEKDGKYLGDISQKVKVKPQTDYIFTCLVKASAKVGVIMIKLLDANGKEVKRISSSATVGSGWETLKINFSTGEADIVLAMLRYTQKTGETLWFSSPTLIEEIKSGNVVAN